MSNYSQETYPKILLSGKDTLVVLLPIQVKQINIVYAHRKCLLAENTLLNSTLYQYTLLNKEKDQLIAAKIATELELRYEIDSIKTNYNQIYSKNMELQGKLKKQRKYWFFSGLGAGILTFLLVK